MMIDTVVHQGVKSKLTDVLPRVNLTAGMVHAVLHQLAQMEGAARLVTHWVCAEKQSDTLNLTGLPLTAARSRKVAQ